MSNLLIEIGNTALKASWADGMTLGKTFRYQGENKLDFITSLIDCNSIPDLLVIASVYEISSSFEKRIKSLCKNYLILDSKHKEIIKSLDLPDYLSFDRVASIVASRYLFGGRSCSIFDFGTTITADFLDSDGNYLMGRLSLGCMSRFKALNRYSKNVPLITLVSNEKEKEDDYKYSIKEGVVSGIMFEIQGWIDDKSSNVVVFTGGDAIYFAKRMKNSIFVICNLVLIGLALIAKNYVEQDN